MTTPTQTSIIQVVIDWAIAAGWPAAQETEWPLFPGPEILDAPDRAVFVTASTGPGYVTEEGSADASAFQARFRGPDNNPLAPEQAARQWEAMVRAAVFPATVDGIVVQHVHRQAGPPVPLPADPADRRFEWTCNYIIVTGA